VRCARGESASERGGARRQASEDMEEREEREDREEKGSPGGGGEGISWGCTRERPRTGPSSFWPIEGRERGN